MASYDPNYQESDSHPSWVVENYDNLYPEDPEGRYVILPHQCSDWRIGDVDDVKALISDLEALIANPPTVARESK